MISRENIQSILEYGVMAPSGENCQPWRFVVREGVVQIFLILERDQSLYSYGQRASYFAHGALLENIAIAARAKGFLANVILFPDSNDSTLVATVTFNEGTAYPENPLFAAIPNRTTNRKPYAKIPLGNLQREEITGLAKSEAGVNLTIIEDPLRQRSIGYAASVNEEMLFSVREMHDFFFSHITWTPEEDAKKSIGFYIETLELPAPAKPMFKVFKKWKIAKLLGAVGLPKQIANGNAKDVYVTGSAHGVVSIRSDRPEDFVHAGRLMERVWLTATSLGLSLQPLAGITFLMQGIMAGDSKGFTESQKATIKDAYAAMKSAYGLSDGDILTMAFRIGIGEKPSARASRLKPDITFI